MSAPNNASHIAEVLSLIAFDSGYRERRYSLMDPRIIKPTSILGRSNVSTKIYHQRLSLARICRNRHLSIPCFSECMANLDQRDNQNYYPKTYYI